MMVKLQLGGFELKISQRPGRKLRTIDTILRIWGFIPSTLGGVLRSSII